jgi:hypothetical protein
MTRKPEPTGPDPDRVQIADHAPKAISEMSHREQFRWRGATRLASISENAHGIFRPTVPVQPPLLAS